MMAPPPPPPPKVPPPPPPPPGSPPTRKTQGNVGRCKSCKVVLEDRTKDVCAPCYKKRDEKWVSRDSFQKQLEAFQKSQQEAMALLQSENERIKETMAAQFQRKHAGEGSAGSRVQEYVNSLEGSVQGDKETRVETRTHNPFLLRNTSAAAGSADQLQDQQSVSSKDSTNFSFHEGTDDRINSCSEMGSIAPSVALSGVQTVKPREKFLHNILSLQQGDEVAAEPTKPQDRMEELFGESEAYKTEAPKALALSQLQKKTLSSLLQPQTEEGRAFTRLDVKNLPIVEEDKHFFETPTINPSIAEYLAVIQSRGDKNQKELISPGPARSCEKVLEKIDASCRVGLRYSVYTQWLLSSLKNTLLDELSESHPLRDPEGNFMQILNEVFVTSLLPAKQFCRATAISIRERRKIFLEEMKLKAFPLSNTTTLPVDIERGLLFGQEELKDGNTRTIDSIISQFSEKSKELQKTNNAFRNQSFGQNRNRPGQKRKSFDDKSQPDKKRQREDNQRDNKQQTNNQGRSYNNNNNRGGYNGGNRGKQDGFRKPQQNNNNYNKKQ